jgi:RND family efflux transporter MFP subunit
VSDKAALLSELRIDRTVTPTVKTPSRRLWWSVGIILCLLLLAGTVVFRTTDAISIPVSTVTAAPIDLGNGPSGGTAILQATGYVVALREASVSAKGIYKVNEVLIQEGDQVKQGQIMARLDDTNARAAADQSRAEVAQKQVALAAARVAADDARPMFARNEKQFADGLISRDAFDLSKASYDAAEQAVAIAKQNLSVAQATLQVNLRYQEDTVIKAPFEGVVTVKTAQPGEIVSPQFSGGGGIAKVVDMDSLEVDVDVNETYLQRVHAAQSATVTLDAYPDWQIPAKVIAVIPTADRAKATVKVRIGFVQKDPRILPEMGARVSFLDETSPVRSQAGAVIVPPSAVAANGDGGTVFVISGDRVASRRVQLVMRRPEGLELTGLEPGTSLAVGNFKLLHDGAKIKITTSFGSRP